MRRQRPEDLLNVDIFFDAVVVHGDEALGESVIAHAFKAAGAARDFQMQLSMLARRWQPPMTLFGGLKVGSDGRIDLKKSGLLPIFTVARALAIKHGQRQRDTPERLRAMIAQANVAASDIEAVLDAHRVLLRFMLRQQLVDIEAGIPPTPKVDLKPLDKADKARLLAAIKSVGTAIEIVGEGRL